MKGYPYAFYIALDGNGINGLEGIPEPERERLLAMTPATYTGLAAELARRLKR